VALSGPERAKVRKYLGWSARFHQTDSRLDQAMDALGGTPDDETEVRTELAVCTDLDAQIAATNTTAKVVTLGSIETRAAYQLSVLRNRGRQAAGRIAAILGVEIRHDAFSGSGPVGFAGPGGLEP